MNDTGERELFARERETLDLLARGLSTREIAKRMYISESTVNSTLRRIYDKLGVTNRVAAVVVASANGAIDIKNVRDAIIAKRDCEVAP